MRKIEGLGKVSCSRLASVNGSPTAWISYREDIRHEWVLLGDPEAHRAAERADNTFVPRPIRHGRDTEERALSEFLLQHPEEFGEFTKSVALLETANSRSTVLIHPRHPWFCGTPDLRWPKSGLETKCPVNEDRHVRKNQPLPTRYYDQIQGYIELTGSEGWWFVSYYVPPPGCTRHDQGGTFYTERWIPRHQDYIYRMMIRAEMFWDYVVQDDVDTIYDYYPKSQAIGDLSALFR